MSRPLIVTRLRSWMLVQAIVWGAVLAVAAWTDSPPGWNPLHWYGFGGFVAASYGSLWWVLGAGRHLADFVTLGRFLGLSAVVAVCLGTGSVTWATWTVGAAMVAADLVDGYCARRFGGSDAGAVLDMETDQFATLFLAGLMYAVHGIGGWVLLLPAFRYAFVLLSFFGVGRSLRALPIHDPKPCAGDNRRARYLCAGMLVASLVAVLPEVAAPMRTAAAATAVGLLTVSYAADLLVLLRRSPAA